ncbi:MAG: DinB family protein [bacterium]
MNTDESLPKEEPEGAGIMTERLTNVLRVLLEEVYAGPPDPRATWITSNELNSGIIGTLDLIPFDLALQLPGPGMNSIATHAAHLLFSLRLACRAMKGENAYANADWKESWRISVVDDGSWQELRSDLRRVHTDLLDSLRGNLPWEDEDFLKGVIALVGHGAYHLGAIRQIQREFAAGS